MFTTEKRNGSLLNRLLVEVMIITLKDATYRVSAQPIVYISVHSCLSYPPIISNKLEMNLRRENQESDKKMMVKKLQPPPWLELPEGIWSNILQRLGAIEILERAQKVCTTWKRLCKHPSMWHVIEMCNVADSVKAGITYDLEDMCRQAVDRSQGELVDISMNFFLTDELLAHVVQRSGKLKRLKISCCYDDLHEGLAVVIGHLPFLEELSLNTTTITTESIEVLGRSCPQLKSFGLNFASSVDPESYPGEKGDERNAEALAIAKNLPGLHHLQLIANHMTNEGLQAILDGCPHLVSLDMRNCFNVRVDEGLRNRIGKQIKDVKYPDDE